VVGFAFTYYIGVMWLVRLVLIGSKAMGVIAYEWR
jgi:hypothetical protein